jgi:hypothetical protein
METYTETDKIVLKLLAALRDLVELKDLKDIQGKTDEYLKRQPAAWSAAKRLVHQYRYFGVRAGSATPFTPDELKKYDGPF